MVKSYLRYQFAGDAGVICSPECNTIFHHDPRFVLCGTNESVTVWDARKASVEAKFLVQTPPNAPAFTFPVTCMARHPTREGVFAVGYSDGSVRLWTAALVKSRALGGEKSFEGENAEYGLGASVKTAQCVLTLHGHKSAVTALDFSPDGSLLASGGQDTDVVVWDTVAESGLYRLRGHRGPVTAVRFFSKTPANGGVGGGQQEGEAKGAKAKRRGAEGGSGSSAGSAAAASSSALGGSPFIVSASKDGTVKLWECKAQWCVQTLTEHRGEVWAVAVTPQMDRLVTGAADGFLRLYAIRFPSTSTGANGVASAGKSARVKVKKETEEDEESGEDVEMENGGRGADLEDSDDEDENENDHAHFLGFVPRENGRTDRVTSLLFVPSGSGHPNSSSSSSSAPSLLLCHGPSRLVEIFRVFDSAEREKRRKRRERRQKEKAAKRQKKKQEMEEAGLTAGDSLMSDIWDDGEEGGGEEGMEGPVGFDKGTDEAVLEMAAHVCVSASGRIRSLDMHAPRGGIVLGGLLESDSVGPSFHLAVALENNQLEIRRGREARIVHFKKDKEKDKEKTKEEEEDEEDEDEEGDSLLPVTAAVESEGHRGPVRSLSLSSEDSMCLSVANESVKVWNTRSLRCIRSVPLDGGVCGFMVAGNEHALVGTKDGRLVVVDLAAAEVPLSVSAGETGEGSGGKGKKGKAGKTKGGDEGATVEAHGGKAVAAVAVCPDLASFASIGGDKYLRFFKFVLVRGGEGGEGGGDAGGGKEVLCIRPQRELELAAEPLNLAISPTGKHVAVSLLDSTVAVLYLDSLKTFLTLYGHKLPAGALSISDDGTLLASGSADKSIRVWGLDFGDCRKAIFAHSEAVTACQFLPKSHLLVSVSRDRVMKLWDLDSFELVQQLFGHTMETRSLAVGTDGGFVVTGGFDRSLRVWRRTGDQLFLSEEREAEMERRLEADAEREDVGVGTLTGDAKVVGESRATRRTLESVRSTERLMEVLDEAQAATDQEKLYKEEVAVWRQRVKEFGETMGEQALPKPDKPTPPLELLGKSPFEHILSALRRVPIPLQYEVLLALPFAYALRLLVVAAAFLDASAETCGLIPPIRDEQETDKEDQFDAGPSTLLLCVPLESVARAVLILLHVHYRQFLVTPEHRSLLLRLRRTLRPLLQMEADRMSFNIAGLSMLSQELAADTVAFRERKPTTATGGARSQTTSKGKKGGQASGEEQKRRKKT
uniref:Small-subunit processome Utp12 domain-containing protein n=1 Tax=Chromera velia CCMP2878 TaxID=1169474 RepID=A0A0G4F8S0_9ALVE|eukprot:Cvel_2937.t1-p1 / transcript=Cvel_2937.t1 / gene=Cvel_2937 / organism=Chromera_velia_CCMP2878 / gene_product=WD repeat-containing protein 3, putative / transcript_product=WD repeat-containing protein 3, putative / location=Cvel_scaffold116:34215-41367(+) / protein_length=1221 / sequence_SO=supercontig / SO=protein_coding / is_pseudo=false